MRRAPASRAPPPPSAARARRQSSVAYERVREARVQVFALAGEDRRVDRLGEERVTETEAATRLVGDEDAVVDRLAQRFTHAGLRHSRQGLQQRIADVAPGHRGQAQHALRRLVEAGDPSQEEIAQVAA